MTWGGAICAAAFASIVLAPIWQPAVLGAIVLGFSFYMLHNTVQTKATEMAPKARGAAVAIYASCWSLGQALGVAAMGAAVGRIGYPPAIIAFGLGFAALGLWMRGNLHRLS